MVSTEPDTETWLPSVIAMVDWIVSVRLLRVMLPVPLAIGSLKVTTRLLPINTPVALSKGLRMETVGGVVSELMVVKFQVVSSAMPAKELPERSLMAVASIRIA